MRNILTQIQSSSVCIWLHFYLSVYVPVFVVACFFRWVFPHFLFLFPIFSFFCFPPPLSPPSNPSRAFRPSSRHYMRLLQLHRPAGKLAPSAGRQPERAADRVHSALRGGGGRCRGQLRARGRALCAAQLRPDQPAAAGEMDHVSGHGGRQHQRGSGTREPAAALPHRWRWYVLLTSIVWMQKHFFLFFALKKCEKNDRILNFG